MPAKLTRNFCIIAHVDHGKTTLSDAPARIHEHDHKADMTDQHLDSMDLEKERGITIKMHPVVMNYPARTGRPTAAPDGHARHVDFAYEVSRSLAACEGALLLIDAAQGVEAQTVANAHLAEQQGLKIIPVINKIDLPSANLELCMRQLEDILTIPAEDVPGWPMPDLPLARIASSAGIVEDVLQLAHAELEVGAGRSILLMTGMS